MRALLAVPALCLALILSHSAPAQTLESSQPLPPMSPVVAAARQAMVDGRFAEGLAMARPEAEAGDAVAQNIMGVAYDEGLGVPRDPVAAAEWYRRAAEQGDIRAQMNLGQILRDGRPGVAIDPVESRRLMQAAVDGGYLPAQSALGRMFERGFGGPTSIARAIELYEAGRAARDPWASEYLAHVYYSGLGVTADQARARALFLEAADLGLGQSMSNYGYMLELGEGGPADLVEAQRRYRAAIDENYARAGYNLAWLISDSAATQAESIEAAGHCAWAMERATPDEHDIWFVGCATLAKWALLE